MEKADRVRGNGRKLRLRPERVHDGCHPRPLRKGNQADELAPRRLPGHPDRAKLFRLQRLNAAEADRAKASDPRGQLPQVVDRKRKPRRRQLSRVDDRRSNSMVANPRDAPAKSKVNVKVSLRKTRRRVRKNRFGSARRRLERPWERLNKADLAGVPLDYISR